MLLISNFFLGPYEETKVRIIKEGLRLDCPYTMDQIENGRFLYEDVIFQCWIAEIKKRPSIDDLVAKLADFVGEAGLTKYEQMHSSYMNNLPLIQKPNVPDNGNINHVIQEKEYPNPEKNGYIQFPSIPNNANNGYIEHPSFNSVTPVRDVGASGYSRLTMSPSGSFELTECRK